LCSLAEADFYLLNHDGLRIGQPKRIVEKDGSGRPIIFLRERRKRNESRRQQADERAAALLGRRVRTVQDVGASAARLMSILMYNHQLVMRDYEQKFAFMQDEIAALKQKVFGFGETVPEAVIHPH
jgi:hypothetical protein